MKIDTTAPVFIPVTLTLETVEELAFFRDVVGRTNSSLSLAYGIDTETFSDVYAALSAECDKQGAPAWMSKGYNIKFELKE
jgi:hypothetical protein